MPEPDVTHLDNSNNNSSLANSIALADSSLKEFLSKSNKKQQQQQQQVQMCHQDVVERNFNDDDQMECDKYAADSYENNLRLLDNNNSALGKKLSVALGSQKKKAAAKRLKPKQKRLAAPVTGNFGRNNNKYAKKSDEDD